MSDKIIGAKIGQDTFTILYDTSIPPKEVGGKANITTTLCYSLPSDLCDKIADRVIEKLDDRNEGAIIRNWIARKLKDIPPSLTADWLKDELKSVDLNQEAAEAKKAVASISNLLNKMVEL